MLDEAPAQGVTTAALARYIAAHSLAPSDASSEFVYVEASNARQVLPSRFGCVICYNGCLLLVRELAGSYQFFCRVSCQRLTYECCHLVRTDKEMAGRNAVPSQRQCSTAGIHRVG